MELVASIYKITRTWPNEEQYGLTSQIRRAAVSIPSNVAEGFGRRATKDYLRMLSIAYASLLEVETQLQIAQMLGFIAQSALDETLSLTGESGRIINGLITSLRSKT
jgi:four helix bundle protein